MKVGSVVRVAIPPEDNVESKGSVERGAMAVVVDGKEKFPRLYQEFVKRIKNHIDEFVWVEWVKSDNRWKGRIDGAYAKWRFIHLRIINSLN